MGLSLAGLSKLDFLGVLLLRLGAGSVIAFHGFPILLGGADAWRELGSAMSLVGIGSFHLLWGLAGSIIQAFGGLALVLGLFTRGISLLLCIIMLFAVAQIIEGQEPIYKTLIAAQLGLCYLALAFIGPGRLSLDRRGI